MSDPALLDRPDLAERIRARDPEALQVVVETYLPQILRAARGAGLKPQEAEDVLVTHPQVMDAAVFGVPDDDLGEAVKAVVQPIDMAQAGPALADELITFCRERIAHFKCPRSVDFADELPRLPTGKLLKRKLRDQYRDAAT